jgi:predicted RNA binding protein YcfA (HicA-like mRNA interferase family)
MPKKIRELKRMLRKAGFIHIRTRGDHTHWRHPGSPGTIVVPSGNDGRDAKDYQEEDVRKAIAEVGGSS